MGHGRLGAHCYLERLGLNLKLGIYKVVRR
jgi:hypothetical protein